MWADELKQSGPDKKGRGITFCTFYIQNNDKRKDIEQRDVMGKRGIQVRDTCWHGLCAPASGNGDYLFDQTRFRQ
jgi:hypothetical protein